MNEAMRKKYLAVIHAQKKKHCLSDDDYRAVLREVVGKESAGDCDEPELLRLAKHFQRFGGASDPRPPAKIFTIFPLGGPTASRSASSRPSAALEAGREGG